MKDEDLDAGFGRVEQAGGLVGTGQLALQTARALLRFYLERSEHIGVPLFLSAQKIPVPTVPADSRITQVPEQEILPLTARGRSVIL